MTDNDTRDRLAAMATLIEVEWGNGNIADVTTEKLQVAIDGILAATDEDHALHFDPTCEECVYLARPVAVAIPTATDEGLRAAPGRWAFLDTETGDWIEVKPGVVHVAALAAQEERP